MRSPQSSLNTPEAKAAGERRSWPPREYLFDVNTDRWSERILTGELAISRRELDEPSTYNAEATLRLRTGRDEHPVAVEDNRARDSFERLL